MAVNIAAKDGVFPLEETGDVLGPVRIAQFPVIIEAGDKKVIGDRIDRLSYRRLDGLGHLFSHIDAVVGVTAAHDGGKFGGVFGRHGQLVAHEQIERDRLRRVGVQKIQFGLNNRVGDTGKGFVQHLVRRQKMGPGG